MCSGFKNPAAIFINGLWLLLVTSLRQASPWQAFACNAQAGIQEKLDGQGPSG